MPISYPKDSIYIYSLVNLENHHSKIWDALNIYLFSG